MTSDKQYCTYVTYVTLAAMDFNDEWCTIKIRDILPGDALVTLNTHYVEDINIILNVNNTSLDGQLIRVMVLVSTPSGPQIKEYVLFYKTEAQVMRYCDL